MNCGRKETQHVACQPGLVVRAPFSQPHWPRRRCSARRAGAAVQRGAIRQRSGVSTRLDPGRKSANRMHATASHRCDSRQLNWIANYMTWMYAALPAPYDQLEGVQKVRFTGKT